MYKLGNEYNIDMCKKCFKCGKKSTFGIYDVSRNGFYYVCGFHTWWFGTLDSKEYKQRLTDECKLIY